MARILVALDDRFLLELWERVLSRHGHLVEVFDDGERARDALTDAEASYDLILCSLRLPSVDGIELLRTARLLAPDTPVAMVSGGWLEEERREAEREGAARLLNKPLDAAMLLSMVADCARSTFAEAPAEAPRERAAERDSDRHASPLALEEAPAAAWAPPPPPARPWRDSAADAAAEPSYADLGPPLLSLAPPLVLVIEREGCARRLVTYCLERQGFRVADAAARSEGLELAEMDTPDLIVLGEADDLPLGEAIDRLRSDPTLRRVPLVVLFEAGHTAEAVHALDQGADVALERPFEPDLLFAHVRAAIRRAHAARPGARAGEHADARGACSGGETVTTPPRAAPARTPAAGAHHTSPSAARRAPAAMPGGYTRA